MAVPAASMFPGMRYFEVDSVRAGARYAIWVVTPTGYDKEPARRFPAVYMPDGNGMAPFLSSLANTELEQMDALQPTIQICVGYAGEDVSRALAVRARDLLPPHEPLPPGTEEMVQNDTASVGFDRATAALYLHYLKNPAADRFLSFLIEELHPFIASNYRIKGDDLGLFGHSYGGLFTAYAALQPSTIFKNFGAASPGIIPQQSMVFKLYADALASGGVTARNLHMTVTSREIADPGLYQTYVAAGAVEFLGLASANPLQGLHVTSQVIVDETHLSGVMPAAFSYLRKLYSGRS
jgi:predicted alpha/beta superfamily hydrolase